MATIVDLGFQFVERNSAGQIVRRFPASGLPTRGGTSRIIIHHTGGTGNAASVHEYHQNGRRWMGIGYNFMIERNGRIVQGRGWNAVGSHSLNQNNESVGIALQGCFHTPGSTMPTPTEEQLRSLVALLNVAFTRWPAMRNSMNNHGGHRDMPGHATNNCPGNRFHSQVRHLLNCGRDFANVVFALNTLRSRGVINDPNYWRDSFHQLEHLNTLIIRFGNTPVANTQVRNFTNARDAINHLANRRIIDSPAYWLSNFHRVRFLDSFFIQFANRIH
ncbi:MAG: peptidoglycan recognition protein family protein [Oscillospiraceae bacterium]|nr:peptidoglycan recognition protein family protein [Oscillospiraceae bacterium]